MAIKYSVEQMKVGFGKDKSEAFVGRVRFGDTISTEKLEEQVGLRTMLPQTVVHTVFANLISTSSKRVMACAWASWGYFVPVSLPKAERATKTFL